jgi:hypothetical protein
LQTPASHTSSVQALSSLGQTQGCTSWPASTPMGASIMPGPSMPIGPSVTEPSVRPGPSMPPSRLPVSGVNGTPGTRREMHMPPVVQAWVALQGFDTQAPASIIFTSRRSPASNFESSCCSSTGTCCLRPRAVRRTSAFS